MQNIEQIVSAIDERFAQKHGVRESALSVSRRVVQAASRAIRAIHRHEFDRARATLEDARALVEELNQGTHTEPDVYWTGYVQDAQKEFAEAHITLALVQELPLPTPDQLTVEDAPYLNGMAEAASELRRYILDLVRHGHLGEGDRLLETMEEVYSYLITIDFPHAITGNLRRSSDQLRGVLERTRGDLTVAMKQEELREALRALEARLDAGEE